MLISIVIPVFNESSNLPHLQERLIRVLSNTSYSYELIYINDGSTDSSLEILKKIITPEVLIIDFSRNLKAMKYNQKGATVPKIIM